MDIVTKAIETYVRGLDPVTDPVLVEMERLGTERGVPIVGPLVGRLLRLLAILTRAEHILELGSGFGYSAYWFALGFLTDGKIVCTDGREENARLAREFFRKGNVDEYLRFEVGDALDLVDRIPGTFDIIFVDIDKEGYPRALSKAYPRLRTGGLLVADNVLWSGRVVTGDDQPSTRGIREFTRQLYSHPGLYTSILPVRDGVAISVKIS